jgi:hypothetical protein
MIVDIIGTGLTASTYDWSRESFKWSVSSFHEVYADKVDLYFSLHEGQCIELENEITLSTYPLNAICKVFDTTYFTSSIAYMIAYALWVGTKEINIFGVDMEGDSEYSKQRPCLAYWIGYCKAKGVKINLSNTLTNPAFKYGYDTKQMQKTMETVVNRMESSYIKAQQTEGRESDQWLGSYHAHKKIVDLLTG